MEPTSPAPAASQDHRRRLVEAVLVIADAGDWARSSLRDVARRADVPAHAAFALAGVKSGLVDLVSDDFDAAAFAEDDAEAEVGDRLFEAAMARLEAMEPHRTAVLALLREEGAYAPRTALRLAKTSAAVLAAAGVDASGPKGALRAALFAATFARVLQVWRDDEGALNRTMAELDKRLKTLRRTLERLGAGL